MDAEYRTRRKLVDIATCGWTIGQTIGFMERFRENHPDMEVFLDGTEYAIMYERRD